MTILALYIDSRTKHMFGENTPEWLKRFYAAITVSAFILCLAADIAAIARLLR